MRLNRLRRNHRFSYFAVSPSHHDRYDRPATLRAFLSRCCPALLRHGLYDPRSLLVVTSARLISCGGHNLRWRCSIFVRTAHRMVHQSPNVTEPTVALYSSTGVVPGWRYLPAQSAATVRISCSSINATRFLSSSQPDRRIRTGRAIDLLARFCRTAVRSAFCYGGEIC